MAWKSEVIHSLLRVLLDQCASLNLHSFTETVGIVNPHARLLLQQVVVGPSCRYAVVSALAASALPSLVLARGHRIEQVPEIPLVVDDSAETLTKTRKALDLLQKLGAAAGAPSVGLLQLTPQGDGFGTMLPLAAAVCTASDNMRRWSLRAQQGPSNGWVEPHEDEACMQRAVLCVMQRS